MSDQKYRILIAPACFKGSLSAQASATVVSDFLTSHLPDYVALDICPIADGGDDTLTVLQNMDSAFEMRSAQVTGPLATMTVQANYLWHPVRKIAVIEAAQAHGFKLLPGATLHPMTATSYGVGQLMKQAIETVQPEILIITVGGSASTDGGLGALQALGVNFLDQQGQPIQEPIHGQALTKIQKVIWPVSEVYHGQVLIATDVVNPLLGKNGTAAVFAPQKGANAKQVALLEEGLTHVNQLMIEACQMDCVTLPGVGAAGGLAYGLRYLPRSGIVSGSKWIADQLGLEAKIEAADLVITGEGCLDATTFDGKATGNILAWAVEKPVIFFCGQVADNLAKLGDVAIYPFTQFGDVNSDAMVEPEKKLLQKLEEALPQLKALLP
jgi:glycerate 2-kinase